VVVFGLATIVFGITRSLLVAWLALATTGAADGISTIIRNTLRQLLTPDHIRGRMTSVNQIFFQGGPQRRNWLHPWIVFDRVEMAAADQIQR
jgi:hypothetical protein